MKQKKEEEKANALHGIEIVQNTMKVEREYSEDERKVRKAIDGENAFLQGRNFYTKYNHTQQK